VKRGADDVPVLTLAGLGKGEGMKPAFPHGDGWLRLASLLAFLALWQVLAWLLDSASLPAPAVVLGRIIDETLSLVLPRHLAITLARVAVSFLFALAIGTGSASRWAAGGRSTPCSTAGWCSGSTSRRW
jgi:NitT/TauT family transport system permease protein